MKPEKIYPILNCPFCGCRATVETKSWDNPNAGYSGSMGFIVKCTKCDASCGETCCSYFNTFSSHTVSALKNNNALRASVEIEYDAYLENVKQEAVNAWNKRIIVPADRVSMN